MNHKFTTSDSDVETEPVSSSPTLLFMKERKIREVFGKSNNRHPDGNHQNFCFSRSYKDYQVIRSYDPPTGTETKIYYTKFRPFRKLSQVCIVHGYGESTDDYLRLADFLAKRGNVVTMFDLRGFGYSGGSRVNQPNAYERMLEDIQKMLRQYCERNLSTFIIAHGMGALIVNALLQEKIDLPISGVICISPLLSFRSFSNSTTAQKLLYWISPWLFGSLLVHNMINPTALTKSQYAIKHKIDSIFFEYFITLNMANQYEQMGQKVREDAWKFFYPTFILYGLKDMIQDPREVKNYCRNISSIDKQIQVLKEGYHQLHKDYESDKIFFKIAKWIQIRRGRVTWHAIPPFVKNIAIRRRRGWGKLLILISILCLVLGLVKKFGKKV